MLGCRAAGYGILALLAAGLAFSSGAAQAQAALCGPSVRMAEGDSLSRIARRCGTTVADILRANPEVGTPGAAIPGTVLRMPPPSLVPLPAASPAQDAARYVVRPGDSLRSIADRLGVEAAVIVSLNPGINIAALRPGETLRVPAGSVAAPRGGAVEIAPRSGPPGTLVRLSASGLPPQSAVRLLAGPGASDLDPFERLRTDAAGRVTATALVPEWAVDARRLLFAFETAAGERILSQPFDVTTARAQRPTPEPGRQAETLPPPMPSAPAARADAKPAAQTARLTAQEVNEARFTADRPKSSGPSGFIMKLQILLDRARISPGVIDGYDGENVRKAVRLFQAKHGLGAAGGLDRPTWQALGGEASDPVIVPYTITPEDVAGPFATAIPQDFGLMAQMERLAYTSAREKLAERFHLDEKALSALNPGVELTAGTQIMVPALGKRASAKVARIVADKGLGQLRAYDAQDNLVAAYPATIGSASTPSPSGTHTVAAIATDPVYYYDPQRNFQQGENTRKLELPPGPNNPVGNVWIGLSKPSYGIHGTPEPSKIGKTASRGCVRLTNWDAQELARLVSKGTTVSFLDAQG
jgi:lipoprotein-anchoring transpeptidase ErfK/SrfK/LysM repeat protein